MEQNLAQVLALELRKRGNKTVKSLYWNQNKDGLSVFLKDPAPGQKKSFNYMPDVDMSVEDIADYIEEMCK